MGERLADGDLRDGARARFRFGLLDFELTKAGDHQSIGLAREGGGQNGMPLSIAREFLGERYQILALERPHRFGFGHKSVIIAHSAGESQPQPGDIVRCMKRLPILTVVLPLSISRA